ncbi:MULTISPECIES: hypothetical protein [Turicibacter]|jgi:hypothetical protein|uniref:Uncharacterized protein n=2 Tax=Turicibacter sanguinis TaxID=154288 RepID=A0A173RAP5_9FIRM|nr:MULTISPECIES: hypothetical protein [Turicibacter]EFF64176.1 hypothetical protein CUW_2539 [Turicibacter sanguinis PC909]EGC90801.1 hypothetical protein HMPREF9402_1224 [Turicibacter sp. HGF1]MBP3905242.1 hypothetical protein [Turicibacter sp.]MCU7190593.1 hypothetical protein [Turicibacter sanguinis]MCU7196921.1 hypothetical protein [Turicibacter sanguinis]
MSLDQKIKQRLFETAFKRLTRHQIKKTDRTARNILEALQLLCGREITEPDLNLIYHELRLRLQHHEAPDVTLAWLLHLLEAYQS